MRIPHRSARNMIHIYCNLNDQLNQEIYDSCIKDNKSLILNTPCPKCGFRSLIFYGRYLRTVILPTGQRLRIRIQKCRCKYCHSVHAVLTTAILPCFLYSLLSMLGIIRKDPDSLADDSYRLHLLKKHRLTRLLDILSNPPVSIQDFSCFIRSLLSDHKKFPISYILIQLPT